MAAQKQRQRKKERVVSLMTMASWKDFGMMELNASRIDEQKAPFRSLCNQDLLAKSNSLRASQLQISRHDNKAT